MLNHKTGLLTIGPRFGGAIDDAARYFKDACDRVKGYIIFPNINFWIWIVIGINNIGCLFQNLTPYEFVEGMKKKGIRVPGIGHR